MTTTPERHDPPTDYICLDEWRDDTSVCVCQLPDGHAEDGHECRCGRSLETTYASEEVSSDAR